MEIEPNLVIERLAEQIGQQAIQIAILQAKLSKTVEAYEQLAQEQGAEKAGDQPKVSVVAVES